MSKDGTSDGRRQGVAAAFDALCPLIGRQLVELPPGADLQDCDELAVGPLGQLSNDGLRGFLRN